MSVSLVENEFKRALEAILMRVFSREKTEKPEGLLKADYPDSSAMAIAFSGGLDSTVLLSLAHRYASEKKILLFAFHVHHGLNPQADAWVRHGEEVCRKLGVPFQACHVQVDRQSRAGTEADARLKRYAALGDLCRRQNVSLLLTAHHEDDQIETILMQLMRGTGIAGLSGMAAVSYPSDLLGNEAVALGRPLLSFSRETLSAWAGVNGIRYVEDDSNRDVRYTRNAVRHRLIPILAELFPGFSKRVTRTASHLRSAQGVLDERAREDLAACRVAHNVMDIRKAGMLNPDRKANLFRYWLLENGIPIPSSTWFDEAVKQILTSKQDAQISLPVNGHQVKRYRQWACIFKGRETRPEPDSFFCFHWQGEKTVQLAAWGGRLLFDESEEGFDAAWLKEQPLKIGPYRGSVGLKLTGRPTKKLKTLCQEAAIPPWERLFLPLLYAKDELIFVGSVGSDARHVKKSGKAVRIRWKPAAGLYFGPPFPEFPLLNSDLNGKVKS